MAKTNTEQIADLSSLAATLTERLDNARAAIKRLEESGDKGVKSLGELTTRLAVIEQQTADIRRNSEESGRRTWSLIPAIVGAIVGAAVGALTTFLLSRLYH